MNQLLLTEISQIPTFEQLREPPKNALEGAWIIGVVLLLFFLWVATQFVRNQLSLIKQRYEAELEEQRSELRQREATVRYLMAQNETLLKERSEMLRSVAKLSGHIAKFGGEVTLSDKDSGFNKKKNPPPTNL